MPTAGATLKKVIEWRWMPLVGLAGGSLAVVLIIELVVPRELPAWSLSRAAASGAAAAREVVAEAPEGAAASRISRRRTARAPQSQPHAAVEDEEAPIIPNPVPPVAVPPPPPIPQAPPLPVPEPTPPPPPPPPPQIEPPPPVPEPPPPPMPQAAFRGRVPSPLGRPTAQPQEEEEGEEAAGGAAP